MKDKLTKEQSAHLISLGVPKEKASQDKISTIEMSAYPIFTLTDLLEILPKSIEENRIMYYLSMTGYTNDWEVEYCDVTSSFILKCVEREELIDSLYELCVWCLENKK